MIKIKKLIRNSTAESSMFTSSSCENSIDVKVKIWLFPKWK